MKKAIVLLVMMVIVAGMAFAKITIDQGNKGESNLCYKDADSNWKCVDREQVCGEKKVCDKKTCSWCNPLRTRECGVTNCVCTKSHIEPEYCTDESIPDGTVEYGLTHKKKLQICVDIVGLEPRKKYQFTLNGEKTENGCTLTTGDYKAYINNILANKDSNPYVAGCWNNEEGWWNFGMGVRANKNGEINRCWNLDLPYGAYKNLKVLVKKDGSPVSMGGNGDNDYQAILMEETADDYLNFNIGEKYVPTTTNSVISRFRSSSNCRTLGWTTIC